jgi:hypothetical protein
VGGAFAAESDLAVCIPLDLAEPTTVEAEYSFSLLVCEVVKDLYGNPAQSTQSYERAEYTYTKGGQLSTEAFFDFSGNESKEQTPPFLEDAS